MTHCKMLGPISMDDLYIVAKTKDTASQAIDRVIVNVLQNNNNKVTINNFK